MLPFMSSSPKLSLHLMISKLQLLSIYSPPFMLHIPLTTSYPRLTTKKISWREQTLKDLFVYILHFQIVITYFLLLYQQNSSWTKSHGHQHLLTLAASRLCLLLGMVWKGYRISLVLATYQFESRPGDSLWCLQFALAFQNYSG